VKLFTIGFTQKSAQHFFDLLERNCVKLLIDVRLHPGGQLSGFAKQEDLRYFLQRLIGCDYRHMPILAPEDDFLSQYRKDHDWETYTRRFEALMDARHIPQLLDRLVFDNAVLLCSEHKPDRCHRRLVAERLARNWPALEIAHLV
jgi:uncharacterized protein (DUF488 family)